MSPCGVFLLNKPVGVRSTACVAALRRNLGKKTKVGHGGALDSTAEGLMVLLAGGATRANDLVTGLPKLYGVEFRLGEERSTEDFSGEITFSGPVPKNPGDKISRLLPGFLGTRLQTPPDISAVWVGGRRAHEIARSGESPEIRPRPVHITSIGPVADCGDGISFKMEIRCHRGTYIRSIVRDIGRILGCGAHVRSLSRRSVGRFSLDRAAAFNELESQPSNLTARILPLSELASHFYCYRCGQKTSEDLKSGKPAALTDMAFLWPGDGDPGGMAAVLGEGLFSYGKLMEGGFFKPMTNIFCGEEQ